MKFKKIAVGIAAAIAASVGVVAYAAHDYDFDIQTYDHGSQGYSGVAYKDDSYDYAAIYCQDGTLSETAFTYFAVCNSSKTAISTETKATSCSNDRYTVDYTTIPGSNEKLYLRSRSGYYGAHAVGYWRP